ncbi:MAG: hypothetical protein U9R52_04445 [Candidatus Omnitrophota bacterium]|nr:hypothetical protein [Candidatus Omnitrophota bacterium]
MEKQGKKTQDDFKKLLEGTKKKLQKMGKETSVWVKKGETELSRLSKMGKLEFDIVSLNMKKEKLFKNIGARMVERGLGEKTDDPIIKNMCDEAKAVMSQSGRKKTEISRVRKKLFKRRKSPKK